MNNEEYKVYKAQKKLRKVEAITKLQSSLERMNQFKANVHNPSVPCNQEQTHTALMNVYDECCGLISNMCQYLKAEIDELDVELEHHLHGHLPHLEMSQIRAILDAAGILDQFQDIKPPITEVAPALYTEASLKEKFKNINFSFKK
jgi:hypothetical protein